MIKKYPFYIRATVILFGLILLVFCLFTLREIFVPLAFALLLAILLNPLVIRFQTWRFPKVLAISLVLALAILIISGIAYLLYLQIGSFSDQLPVFKKKAAELGTRIQSGLSNEYGISVQKQNQYITEAQNGLKPVMASIMGTALGTLSVVLLLP